MTELPSSKCVLDLGNCRHFLASRCREAFKNMVGRRRASPAFRPYQEFKRPTGDDGPRRSSRAWKSTDPRGKRGRDLWKGLGGVSRTLFRAFNQSVESPPLLRVPLSIHSSSKQSFDIIMSTKKGGSKPQREPRSYEVRDIVLGKVRGYAPWPGMVVDPETVPAAVSEDRPTNKKATFYCVRFFPAGDYAWLVEKDISKLQPHEIESYISEPHKKSADLLEGYRIALDPAKWLEERDALASEAAEAEENAEVDQLNSDGEATASTTKSRKRKRESESASAKVKKTAKGKKDESASAKKRSSSTASGRRKNGAKSKAMVESEDEGGDAEGEDEDAGPSKNASPPPAKKQRREKGEEDQEESKGEDPEALKVRDWRHKLQKSFLGKTTPKEEDMPVLDELFKTVENFDGITIEHLQFSKIGKVMRHITALPDHKIPGNDTYKFRERSSALVQKWHQILNVNKANGEGSASAVVSAAPNGASASGAGGSASVAGGAGAGQSASTAGAGVGGEKTEAPVSKKSEEVKEGEEKEKEKEEARAVTEGTAALDLNGGDKTGA
ncbi:hypothetical protein CC2G_009784 [Coprinopsis cinerea AmutBmut pab1-1]|nr:hypothetical protein CC2G_009784 [Coprinopsis cinerea AmutBmut pab1-1]